MAGCVPVCWLIEGITDFIVEHGKSGFVHPLGDNAGFARSVALLDKDRVRLKLMSRTALGDALNRFTHQQAADSYAELFKAVMVAPPPKWDPLSWRNFHSDPNFGRSWVAWIPDRVKCWVKKAIVRRKAAIY